MLPDAFKNLRKNHISFPNPESNQVSWHQRRDFKLEERRKLLKRMASKRKKSSQMWLKIARSFNKVNEIVELGVKLLSFGENGQPRVTDIMK